MNTEIRCFVNSVICCVMICGPDKKPSRIRYLKHKFYRFISHDVQVLISRGVLMKGLREEDFAVSGANHADTVREGCACLPKKELV